MRRGPKPAKSKEAKPPVGRKSSKDDGFRVGDLEKRLAEALSREKEGQEQQAATAEILRVISQSPANVQPVFDAVAENAARLCEAFDASIYRRDFDRLLLVAHHGAIPVGPVGEFSLPLIRGTVPGRSVLDRRTVHVADLQAEVDEFPESSENARRMGFRTGLVVPLVREGVAIGTIVLRRTEARLFTERQITLLKTFADQAVIAIENVRLFNETKESLEQQTATAELLRVISSSTTDVQPVFETIVASCKRLLNARSSAALRLIDNELQLAAFTPTTPEADEELRRYYPRPVDGATAVGIVARECMPFVATDTETDERLVPAARAVARARGYRSLLIVPMLRKGEAIGTINVTRSMPGSFADKDIALLQTFADQAVIAIENVRLFKELQEKNSALTTAHAQVSEALEQQTATSEILRAISSSPTDVQPVFDAIASSAARLCQTYDVFIRRLEGDSLRTVAHHGPIPASALIPVGPGSVSGRAVLERRTIHVVDVQAAADELPEAATLGREFGHRTNLGVPLLREGVPRGVIVLRRAVVSPFTEQQITLLQTFADQAVIAIENVRLFKELQTSNRDLTTALDKQTATSDILRVISRSQTDVQPVFDVIVASAVRLLSAHSGLLTRIAGDRLKAAAFTSIGEAYDIAMKTFWPRPLHSEGVHTLAIRDRAPVNIADAASDPRVPEDGRAVVRLRDIRSMVSVPLLRHDEAIGTIAVYRRDPGGFTDDEIALLQTFADQAVIAIENVRLFNETKEALEQQTAASDILSVISRSPTDVQPVFDAVAESAARLCEAQDASIFRRAGDQLFFAAHHGPIPFGRVGEYSMPLVRETLNGRCVLEGRTMQVADMQIEEAEFPQGSALARRWGYRTVLTVPLMRDRVAIGSISLRRTEVKAFTERQIALLQTFADQAVIAIENVRLFKELEASNGELHISLEQQTATSEVLRVISRSQTDVQPVFAAILDSAVRLCGADTGGICRILDGQLVLVAFNPSTPENWAVMRESYPRPVDRTSLTGRAVVEARVVHVPDIEHPDALPALTSVAKGIGFRSHLSMPILRDGQPIGVLALQRRMPGPFTEAQIELVQTFADQAVIAIENVRLLAELQARTAALTRSVEQLTALGEVSRAVSSTLDIDAVLNTIVSRASELAGDAGCSIYEYDESTERFELRAAHHYDREFVEALRASTLRRGEGLMGRAAEIHEPAQIPDITQPGAYESSVRDTLIRFGYRALLSVPLVREEQIIGSLSFNRKTPGEFSPEVVDVLKTFATQSALAIQNARLFREIEDKSRQLEVASQHKSEFLANMSHELRTPLNAIIGFSEVLTDRMFGELNEKQDEYLKDIYASGTHLLSLINDILDLSKIEAGRMELELTDFHLPTALDNALTLVRERATRRGIALHTNVDERLGQIQADERKIRQVVLNLLSNAIKFTPEGGRIEVAALPKDGSVEVSVSDTGVGIAPADHEAVFEEFRQVGMADKKAEGTGLGLTLCRKFIELHGGRIWVASQVGVGSTFTFTIPVRRGE